MRRRRFLATTASALPLALAGCSAGTSTPDLPDGVTVETRHWSADVLEEGLWHYRSERDDPPEYYYTTIDSPQAARDRVDDGQAAEFVRETDFERSFVVIAQNVMQSARWLALRSIERTDAGLRVLVSTESPDEPYGDDAAVHSLVIRTTDEGAAVPADVTVEIEGHATEAAASD